MRESVKEFSAKICPKGKLCSPLLMIFLFFPCIKMVSRSSCSIGFPGIKVTLIVL